MKQSISTLQIENRPYNEDATPEEIEAIRDRVYIHEGDIIYYDEVPVMTPFSTHILFDKMNELVTDLDQFAMIIDLRNSQRPDALSRRAVNERFGKVSKKLYHAGFCTGKNILINTAVKFVLFRAKLKSYSINKSLEHTIAAIKNNAPK